MSRHGRLVGAAGVALALVLASVGVAGPDVRHARASVSSHDQRASAWSSLNAVSARPRSSLPARMMARSAAVNPVFRPLLPQLKGVTVPVLLPTYIPLQNAGNGRLYATVDDRGTYSYLIDIGFTPDCRGATACRLGEVTGGPEVDTPTIFDYPRGRHVRLRNGALALYYPYTCGAGCGDSVLVFQVDGTVYTASLKAGSLSEVLAMANSFAPASAS